MIIRFIAGFTVIAIGCILNLGFTELAAVWILTLFFGAVGLTLLFTFIHIIINKLLSKKQGGKTK